MKNNFALLLIIFIGFLPNQLYSADFYVTKNDNTLANGQIFENWEEPQQYIKTYYVDQKNPKASDTNNGAEKSPFKTIARAAEVLQAGERVVIKKGIYRESVHPAQGGASPEKMISYEAARGEEVIICGSIEVPNNYFKKSEGWLFSKEKEKSATLNCWQIDLNPKWFVGYNPFGMTNLMSDTEWLDYKKAKMEAHFQRRGLLFSNGQKCIQVAKPLQMDSASDFSFWPEHNGLRLHLKLPKGKTPADYHFEATNKEQVFAPKTYGLGYIRLKGITFRHAGNGFPVPQRGMVSTTRGHHWIVEDCKIEWANSVGMDMGNEMWSTISQPLIAHHIIRRNIFRNCGISGLQCYIAKSVLLEDNLFEKIGFHNAEHAFESGGVKFHQAENSLIQRNIFTKITHAPGLWLDYNSNTNCRITNNMFTDISTARGGIYIEVSKRNCRVDHNVFYNIRSQYWLSGEYGAGGSAFYTDGSDSINFDHNVMVNIESTGYGSYLNAERIVDMRGGITSFHNLSNNIFVDCRKHCIEFPNTRNFSDNNQFINPKPAYIKLNNSAPALLLDKEAVFVLFGWEKNSRIGKATHSFDSAKNILNLIFEANQIVPFGFEKTENKLIFEDPRKK
ncbi:MAG: hypothetical protein AUK44_06975 [Porphyromonadaceae bacterium CG2_30_38_12]|nr:MAG: hypothetical protein AUK44_06975 [Porphyromonadaceae bacterium CG2_30_38_12]